MTKNNYVSMTIFQACVRPVWAGLDQWSTWPIQTSNVSYRTILFCISHSFCLISAAVHSVLCDFYSPFTQQIFNKPYKSFSLMNLINCPHSSQQMNIIARHTKPIVVKCRVSQPALSLFQLAFNGVCRPTHVTTVCWCYGSVTAIL